MRAVLLRRTHRSHRCIMRFSLKSVSIISTTVGVSASMATHLISSERSRITTIKLSRGKRIWLSISLSVGIRRGGCYFCEGTGHRRAFSAEPTGGTGVGYNNRGMPSTMKNWEGTEVSTVVAGFQHDLYLLDSALYGDECAADLYGGECQDLRKLCFWSSAWRLMQTPISRRSIPILLTGRVLCIQMPVVALHTLLRSGMNGISGKLIMWLRLSLGKRFWKRRRSFCIGGQRTETTFFAWSHRDSPGGFSQRCLFASVCLFDIGQMTKREHKFWHSCG